MVYGEPVFVTISPSSRHSGLVMRLPSVRANGPLLQHEEMLLADAQKLGSGWYPILEVGGDMLVDMPDYEARRHWRARDGLCIIDAFKVYVMLGVARVFGVRTCPFCPTCNEADLGQVERGPLVPRPLRRLYAPNGRVDPTPSVEQASTNVRTIPPPHERPLGQRIPAWHPENGSRSHSCQDM